MSRVKVSLGENLFLEYQGRRCDLNSPRRPVPDERYVRRMFRPGVIESIRVLADTTAVEIYVNGGGCFCYQILSGNAGAGCEVGGCESDDGKIYVLKNYVME